MNNKENEEFTAHLRKAVREAEQLKYFPNRFKGMLDGDGGYETVKRILASGRPSEGFEKLWELGRVDLTCEAIIVETKWRRHFDDDLLERAERLLRQIGYPFKRFEEPEEDDTRHAPARQVETSRVDSNIDDLDTDRMKAGLNGEEPFGGNVSAFDESAASASDGSRMGINAFFRDVLHAPVANARWSWGAVDERSRRVFLRLWRMDIVTLEGQRVIRVLGRNGGNRPGWNERVRHIELIKSGHAAYAVMCDKESPEAGVIQAFDRDTVRRLGSVIEADGMLYMQFLEVVPVDAIRGAGFLPDGLQLDLQEINRDDVPSTTRSALIDARLGQGRFRRELMRRWNGACAVTGCRVAAVLRASHCKPWRESDNRERLDSNNGLILAANLDALFDAGLISFDDKGQMIVAGVLSMQERDSLGIPAKLMRAPSAQLRSYLQFHRENVFLG